MKCQQDFLAYRHQISGEVSAQPSNN